MDQVEVVDIADVVGAELEENGRGKKQL